MVPKNDEEKTTVTVKLKEKSNSKNGYEVIDPISELNLGEQAYKIEVHDSSDTNPALKKLGAKYYSVRGGEIEAKEFDENRENVIFNRKRSNEFKIPIEPKASVNLNYVDRWFSDKADAVAVAKVLTEKEQERVKESLDEWKALNNFFEQQLSEELY